MRDEDKTREQLSSEIEILRRKLAGLQKPGDKNRIIFESVQKEIAFDNLLEGYQTIGFDWRYAYVNDACARHGGKSKEELIGHKMMEVYPGIENTEMFAALRRCMDERIPQRMDNEFSYSDGSRRYFELSIQPVPEGISILSIDITERKRAEEALQESEKMYRTLFEKAPDGVFISDCEGRYVDVNATGALMLGYTRDELLQLRISDLVSEFEAPRVAPEWGLRYSCR